MEKLSIEFMGLILYEPITYLSNILLAMFSLFWYTRLRREDSGDSMSQSFSRYFLFMALAPLISGQAHLFDYYIDHNFFHVLGWSNIAVATYYFKRGSAMDFSLKVKDKLNWIFIVLLIASISTYVLYQFFGDIDLDKTTIGVPGFAAVSIFTAISYVGFIVPLNYIKLQRDKNAGSGLILLGIVLTIGTLVVHSKKFSLSPHLNYNVLAHVILIFCYYLYFLGMRKKIRGYEGID